MSRESPRTHPGPSQRPSPDQGAKACGSVAPDAPRLPHGVYRRGFLWSITAGVSSRANPKHQVAVNIADTACAVRFSRTAWRSCLDFACVLRGWRMWRIRIAEAGGRGGCGEGDASYIYSQSKSSGTPKHCNLQFSIVNSQCSGCLHHFPTEQLTSLPARSLSL
jgi:hypothetical protein